MFQNAQLFILPPLPAILTDMKTLVISLFILIFTNSIYTQTTTFFVVGDNVNIRIDTTFTSNPTYKVDYGTKFIGKKENENWYSYYDELMDEKWYVSTKYAVNESDFINAAKHKDKKNGITKFELMLHYKKEQKLNTALDYLIDIINHNSREFYQKYEYCNLLGPMSYQRLTRNNKGETKYNDNLVIITDAVINLSKDSLLKSLAYIDKAKHYLRTGDLNKTSEILFLLIINYSQNLIIPIPCEYDAEGKIYPIINLKNLFFSMYHTMERQNQMAVIERLRAEHRNSHSNETHEILMDIHMNINGSFWKPYKN